MAKVEEDETNTSTTESWKTSYTKTVCNMETDGIAKGKWSSQNMGAPDIQRKMKVIAGCQ